MCNKNAREVNQAKSKAASSQCYAPRNCHGCVDGENLVICVCISCHSVSKTEREEKNQGVEDSAVNPPDIEDHSLPGEYRIREERTGIKGQT